MLNSLLLNEKYLNKSSCKNMYFNNQKILYKYFSNYLSCKIQPKSISLIFSIDKKCFGVKRVVQKRKYMLKLIQPHQEKFDIQKYRNYIEKEKLSEKININNINIDNEKEVELYENYLLNYKYNKREVEKNATLPLSLLSSSFIRRTIYSNREDVLKSLKNINWKKYCCNVKGVRWHASGAWRVLFCKRNYQHNFFVKCDCYFRVSIYGFEKSKELAVLYRKRLEYEYLLLMKRWKEIEIENAKKRKMKKESEKNNESFEDENDIGKIDNEYYNDENS
ncbi:transcription factor with AP2 domain(s), putative [Plasmodium gallinaceum]|uniref:Transcription factor with AP2 domain(S), putative n=1 Tax=Plasmodium gallinaceum TaxID=5849 RepID=A0A1J1GMY2_PLAGA|nr:transcription factor with AP2 domain(s), putative [Plasmodium gallinaceum]CRG93691.1 transcription factor with AP2 domain(s), putative [Plasmodium gallinaceum]